MTIYEIKRLTQQTSPYFFSRETMRFFGQTMKDFRVYKQPDGRYKIIAPSYWNGKLINYTIRYFNPKSNELERE